jgi:hypothetical protein
MANMAKRHISAILLTLAISQAVLAQTTNNDDSCDISVAPAATLLLPLFEVDLAAAAGAGQTTVFTVTNVTAAPQIAHVTLWTDWAYPLLTFNLFLTGYDTQTINLYDVLVRDVVAPAGPGTSSTNFLVSPHAPQGSVGAFSAPLSNLSNPNILAEAVMEGGSCSGTKLPGVLPVDLMNAVRTALTTGLYNPANVPGAGCGNARIGSTHATARGYVTIDVVNTCSTRLPDDREYIVQDLLFDNALTGDYEQLDADTTVGNFAAGNPMVHLRAIPEGGAAGSDPGTSLPYTFYDRTMAGSAPSFSQTFDRRQPLPSVFAARWIEGPVNGFQTNFTIWREAVTFGTESCFTVAANSAMPIGEIVRFDERENSFGLVGGCIIPCPPPPTFPAAARVPTINTILFPANASTVDTAGWLFLDLNSHSRTSPTARPSQNWVAVTMFASGRYSVQFDAAHLGNGCSPGRAMNSRIGPAKNTNP